MATTPVRLACSRVLLHGVPGLRWITRTTGEDSTKQLALATGCNLPPNGSVAMAEHCGPSFPAEERSTRLTWRHSLSQPAARSHRLLRRQRAMCYLRVVRSRQRVRVTL